MRAAVRSVLFSAIQGIDLDFVRGRYASNSGYRGDFLGLPGATYTRAGAATAETAAGAIINFAANVPRITDRGVLIEEARTNLLLGSTLQGGVNQPTWWDAGTNTGTSRGPVASTRGAPGAWQASATNGRESFSQIVTLAANTTYTVSVFVESVSGDTGVLSYAANLPAGATTGSIISPSTPGLYTYQIVVAATAGTTQIRLGLGCSSNNSGAGTVRFSSVQLEAGAFATSYIPTTGATATRAADIMNLTVPAIASGTILVSSAPMTVPSGISPGLVALFPASGSLNYLGIAGPYTASGNVIVYRRAQSVTSSITGPAPTPGASVSAAVSFGVGSSGGTTANGLPVVTTADQAPAFVDLTVLRVGRYDSNPGHANTYIQAIEYFPHRLNDAQLIALTTL